MTLELAPPPPAIARRSAEPYVRREDIRFFDAAPRRVRVEITVHNPLPHPSRATRMQLQAAPFGAFVDWRPLATLRVPSIPPRGSTVVATEVERGPAPSTHVDPPRDAVRKLFTASGSSEPRRPRPDRRPTLATLQMAAWAPSTGLPPDVQEILGHANPHWAGNLNVLIGDTAVERHMARALRIHPGRPNFALFMLGSRSGSYAFSFTGLGASWEPLLMDVLSGSLISADGATTLDSSPWRGVVLAVRPPECAECGKLDVIVDHHPSGAQAVVEFDLDPAAAGPGCFTV